MSTGVANPPRGEWIAQLTQRSDVVVSDVDGSPSPIGVAKALSIIQSLTYLERRTIQLLVPLTKESGVWWLVTLDFGLQAQNHESEFLMCFAFEASNSMLSSKSPYAEIGFSLTVARGEDPLFILTVNTAVGLSR